MLKQSLSGLSCTVLTYFAFLAAVQAEPRGAISIAAICDSAAMVASSESGVPHDVLRAISLTETGRTSDGQFAPWPWTVNMEGVGKWFDDVGEARGYVDRHFARGARSFDVGCFQINYKWHGDAFASIDEMFDPISNARYAALFLSELYQEFGSWSKAAGAYHSRTPKFAKRYSARFNRIRASLSESDLKEATLIVAPHNPSVGTLEELRNSYPFLSASGERRGASLVPLARSGPSLLARDARPAFLDLR